MNFVNFLEFNRDITAWERQLPEFDAVCGVPRSGLIPAAYIALRRNIRLVELSDLLRQPAGAIERACLRGSNPSSKKLAGNKLLIVDDSSSPDSITFRNLRECLSSQSSLQITYGAVYRASSNSLVDVYYREIALPRLFEWNWFRNSRIQAAMLDMDGVICEDWLHRQETSNDTEFAQHVLAARPLYPPQVPVRAVVTSRIERYRKDTTAWLTKHNVQYGKLIMHPARTPEDRQRAGDHAARKARAYHSDVDAQLFIESDAKQASEIFKLTKKPVLCTSNMAMFQL